MDDEKPSRERNLTVFLTGKFWRLCCRVNERDEVTFALCVVLGLLFFPVPLAISALALLVDAVLLTAKGIGSLGKAAASRATNARYDAEYRRSVQNAKPLRIAEEKRQAEEERLRPQREAEARKRTIDQLQSVYAAKADTISRMPGIDPDTRQAALNQLVEELSQKLGQL